MKVSETRRQEGVPVIVAIFLIAFVYTSAYVNSFFYRVEDQ